jgi:transposase
MAKGYRPVARDQLLLLPPDMADWLGGDHPVWLVIRVVEEHLDTSAAHRLRRAGGPGAAGYDPDMLVALLIWAYAHGVVSSRQIERLCRTDVAFRVVCGGGTGPDHVTVARFRAGLGTAAEDLFAGVLGLCAKLGMGQLGTVALDGTKIAASAAASANRTGERLRELARELAAAHAAADAAEDDLFGDARGDELPPEIADPRTRDERIAAALAGLAAEKDAARAAREAEAAQYLAAAAAAGGVPRPGQRPVLAEVAAARLRAGQLAAGQEARIAAWDQRNAAKIAATGKRLREHRPKPPGEHARTRQAAARLRAAEDRAAARDRKTAAAQARQVRNVTDPHSRLMPVRGGGFIQGYNAQNVVTADGLILATALTQDTTDTAWFEPMLRKAEAAAALITASRPARPGTTAPGPGATAPGPGATAPGPGATAPGPGATAPDSPGGQEPCGEPGGIGLILADAGYCSEHNLTCPGPDRLIAVGKRRDLEKAAAGHDNATPKKDGTATRQMAARLKTPDGITTYRQRGHIAETPHGHIKHNMRFRQLSVRGITKTTAEWALVATVHNMCKAITTGTLTLAALDNLATT